MNPTKTATKIKRGQYRIGPPTTDTLFYRLVDTQTSIWWFIECHNKSFYSRYFMFWLTTSVNIDCMTALATRHITTSLQQPQPDLHQVLPDLLFTNCQIMSHLTQAWVLQIKIQVATQQLIHQSPLTPRKHTTKISLRFV